MKQMLDPLTFKGLSDKGLVRQNNEDFWGTVADKRFFVLADGMGGHQAGEVASKVAVEATCSLIESHWKASNKSIEESKNFLQKTIQEANKSIYEMSLSNADYRGMGTTICCMLFHMDTLVIAHVGDSRIYRLRNEVLEQLTKDHSLYCELSEKGFNNIMHYKHVLTKALGTEPQLDPMIQTLDYKSGDIYMMCTDGLTDLLTNLEIEKILNNTSIESAPLAMINLAKERGGYDNITILEVKVHDANIS